MIRPTIRAVAFDYGNVLSQRQDPILLAQLQALAGLEPEKFASRYMRRRLDYDRGTLSTAEYWADVMDTGQLLAPGRLSDVIRTDVASWLHFDDEMVAWAAGLRSVGVATAILSNMPPDILDGLRRSHESTLEQFAVKVFSCEIGLVKPEPEVYELLIERLGLPAASVLFVDDREENVAAAVRLGMRGVRFDSPERFWQQLEAEYDLPLPRAAEQKQVGIG